MPAAGIATIIVSLIILVAVALYLVRVIVILRSVNDSLGKITFGLRAIAHRVSPLGELLGPAKADLEAVADALEGAVNSVKKSEPAA